MFIGLLDKLGYITIMYQSNTITINKRSLVVLINNTEKGNEITGQLKGYPRSFLAQEFGGKDGNKNGGIGNPIATESSPTFGITNGINKFSQIRHTRSLEHFIYSYYDYRTTAESIDAFMLEFKLKYVFASEYYSKLNKLLSMLR